jgi:hypothetical protein
MNVLHKINKTQRLFVMDCGGGYSCLGFDVERAETKAIHAELGLPGPLANPGTPEAWQEYVDALEKAENRFLSTGERMKCGLHPKLMGKEGMRVECLFPDGKTSRFWVGRSTGFIPCHIELKRTTSSSGAAISPWISPWSEIVHVRDLGLQRLGWRT